jgi:hypothetical protein
MEFKHQFCEKAKFLRKSSGSTDIEKTLQRAVKALADRGIPSLVVGGYAVQENGYPRYTTDVDIVVPEVALAISWLSISGFKENQGSTMTVTDRTTKVEVDLLPAGGNVGPGPLNLPIPVKVTMNPNIADLRTLLEIKLSSYMGSPGSRLKDAADVVELIKANNLPRDLAIHPDVRDTYLQLWDNLFDEREDNNNVR